MAHVTVSKPVDEINGKLNTPKAHDGSMYVFRRKCFGTTKRGKKIMGPRESYIMHRHEGKWSEGAVANRERFSALLKQAHAELKDPARKAYWQELFEEHWEHPTDGKRYKILSAFVVAKLAEQSGNQTNA